MEGSRLLVPSTSRPRLTRMRMAVGGGVPGLAVPKGTQRYLTERNSGAEVPR